ncbi:MAG: SMC-Scp complex subunit ScpB [Nitrospirales bacterium]|nr:SMC-Scp complex subunit ScpB [Nitrospirales bacterium]
MEDCEKKAVLETLLFVAGEPASAAGLAKAMEVQESEIRKLVEELIGEYRSRNGGILLVEIAEGYQLVTNPDHAPWVKRFKNISQTNKLSQPALETLAIIAYKQPVTKLEVDQLRGVNSDAAVRSLIEKRFIRIVGKKESPGRPFLYGTTKEFLHYFGLRSLSELPPISDFLKEETA